MDKNHNFRPAWLEINLNNLSCNFRKIKKIVSPSVKILACVKKDAYGHGLIEVSKRLVEEGVDYLGVACLDEGIRLRMANINKPILVMGAVLPQDTEPFFKYDIIASVSDWSFVYALGKKAQYLNKKIKVHIKIDTGMGRLGILFPHAYEFIKRVNKLKFIEIEGLFTHFPLADTDKNFTFKQIECFKKLRENLSQDNIHIPIYHAANSIATVLYKESHFDMVRPGIILYGIYPKKGLNIGLKPVMSLKAKIVLVKKVPSRYGISYGHTYHTLRPTHIAVLPVGYGDGYPRLLSNKAKVIIRGKKFRICGIICMDQFMVDTGYFKPKVNEEAVLIGSQGNVSISAEELAYLAKTIPYEIITSLGNRLVRVSPKL